MTEAEAAVGTLVRGAWVLTQGPAGELRDAAVAIEGGRIVAVDSFSTLRKQHPDAEVIGDGTGIVTPGFVNAHTHLSEALATGIGSELRLAQWGAEIIGPLGAVLTEEDAREGTRLRAVELLLSGVTTVNDMFVHYNPDAMASLGVVAGLQSAGLRGVVSFGAEDVGEPGAAPWGSRRADPRRARCARRGRRRRRLVSFRYGVGTLLGQTDELLEAGIAHARRAAGRCTPTCTRPREELAASLERWGERPIAHAEALGLFDVPVIAGHAVWVDDAEIALLAERGVAVAHNPVANAILGSGVAPVPRLRAAGIPVGIGTDGAASNDSQNMLEAIKWAALLQKVQQLDPAVDRRPRRARAWRPSAAPAPSASTIGSGRSCRACGRTSCCSRTRSTWACCTIPPGSSSTAHRREPWPTCSSTAAASCAITGASRSTSPSRSSDAGRSSRVWRGMRASRRAGCRARAERRL